MTILRAITVLVGLGWTSCWVAAAATADEDWTGFQNGGRNSNSIDSVPTQWSPVKGIAWKLRTPGYGQSSPVVYGDSIYVTSVSGANKEKLFVTAIDRKSGKQLWSVESKNSGPEKSSEYISRAAPSPVCDDAGVIAFFEGGNLVALDVAGKPRWQLDLVEKYGLNKARHGLASSLTQNDDHVFVWVERESDPYLIAVAKSNGKIAWKTNGLGSTTWSSPCFVEVDGEPQLVLSASGKIAGFDCRSGKPLWIFDKIANNSSPTPMSIGDNRLLVGASLGRGEQAASSIKSNGVIEIKKSGDSYSVDWAWKAGRATSSFGSPIAYRGHAYFVNNVGAVYCHDLKTGKQVFVARSPSGSIWATPIGIGEHLFLFGKDGRTAVIKAGPKFELLAQNDLWKIQPKPAAGGEPAVGKQVLYAAVAVESQLLIRSGQVLYSIGN